MSVHVVVPVRDEELLLGRCLESVRRAEVPLRAERPEVATTVTVVLDRCLDGSEAVAAQDPSVHVLRLDAGSVGAAGAYGVAAPQEVTRPSCASSTALCVEHAPDNDASVERCAAHIAP